ncbi:MAG: hypothetical protein JWN13_5955 [Betaproteobacteria bacterium]|jgi:hypothetical protein|nr:hypothetical protein [Betaproteobacteria bacterium]
MSNEVFRLEAYKAFITVCNDGFKYLALVNGAGAIALVTYLVSAGRDNCARSVNVSQPMSYFVAGVVLCGLAILFSYMAQIKLVQDLGNEELGNTHPVFIFLTVLLFMASLGSFAIACVSAVRVL